MNPALQVLEKKALQRLKKNKTSTNSDNPCYERVPVVKNGKIVRYKTEKRPLPPGLTENEGKILKRVRKRAYRWDMGFRCCCGIKFGWASIIGLLPVIGDFADFLMALSLIRTASKVDGGLPKRLYAMMFSNILIDLAAGFVPVIGDVIDVFYRANTRNAWLLDAYLTEVGKGRIEGAIRDPDSGKLLRLPTELQGRPEDGDVERGIEPADRVEPAPVTPAAAPSPRETAGPIGGRGGGLASAGFPGRSLTGQQKVDPREQRGKSGKGGKGR